MIYVRRDPTLIPEKVLLVAERAQAALEALHPSERVAFIKKKSFIWRGFKKYLSKMSFGKCWYSESPDPQSFFDVDHFRPKSEARRSETLIDDGYPWLAFDWDNFRYSTGRSNRLSSDEETDVTVGKSSWFPLAEGSFVATWGNRDVKQETPILIDPTDPDDARLVSVNADGRIVPSRFCVGMNIKRVTKSAELYGLNLPNITEARKRAMRDVAARTDSLMRSVSVAMAHAEAADGLPILQEHDAISKLTLPCSAYSLAVRSQLIQLGFPELIANVENQARIAAEFACRGEVYPVVTSLL